MNVNDRLALEIGKPALRAALAEAQIDALQTQLADVTERNAELTAQLAEALVVGAEKLSGDRSG